MVSDSYEIIQDKNEDEMILVAGDGDYVPAILNITKRGIRVVVWFWDHAAVELKNTASGFFSLNQYLMEISR